MYSKFQLAKKYLHYYLTASNGKGHGVHSPFVFDFISNVLRDKKEYDCYSKIEALRQELSKDTRTIDVKDFGAGSTVIKSNRRIIKDIARSSLKPKKYAQLLYRIVQYYKPSTIVELGTSLGITSAYLASGNPAAKLYTCEGASTIAAIAQNNFDKLEIGNIELIQGNFDTTFDVLLSRLDRVDLAFVDGNHRKEPTVAYFNSLLQKSGQQSIFIFDDIHWSAEMEAAWEIICQNPAVTLSIDLFFIGIVCVNTDFRVKQQFSVSY